MPVDWGGAARADRERALLHRERAARLGQQHEGLVGHAADGQGELDLVEPGDVGHHVIAVDLDAAAAALALTAELDHAGLVAERGPADHHVLVAHELARRRGRLDHVGLTDDRLLERHELHAPREADGDQNAEEAAAHAARTLRLARAPRYSAADVLIEHDDAGRGRHGATRLRRDDEPEPLVRRGRGQAALAAASVVVEPPDQGRGAALRSHPHVVGVVLRTQPLGGGRWLT